MLVFPETIFIKLKLPEPNLFLQLVEAACESAIRYVKIAISQTIGSIGSGNGPINHFHPLKWSPYEG